MKNKNYLLAFLKLIIPVYYDIKIGVNNHKIFKSEKTALKVCFSGAILTYFIGFFQEIKNVENHSFMISVYFFSIMFTNEFYHLILTDRKIPLPDYLIIKHSVLRIRKFNPKNFNLKLSQKNSKIIYDYLISIEYIKSDITSLGVFDTVLRKDFGHDFQIALNLNISQIRSVFQVFEKNAKGFSSIALRKELFLDKDLKKIKAESYRNTSSKNNKKALDLDFQNEIEGLDNIMSGFSN